MLRNTKGHRVRGRRSRVNGVHPHMIHTRTRMAKRNGGELSNNAIKEMIEKIKNHADDYMLFDRQSNGRMRCIVFSDYSMKWYFVVYSKTAGTIVTSLPLRLSIREMIWKNFGKIVNYAGREMEEIIKDIERAPKTCILAEDGYTLALVGQRWHKFNCRDDGFIDFASLTPPDVYVIGDIYGHMLSRHGFILNPYLESLENSH